jgi:hypothetical protein
MGAALLVFAGIPVAVAFLLATMPAFTDAAFGRKVVSDPAVPERVRPALDVERGADSPAEPAWGPGPRSGSAGAASSRPATSLPRDPC